MVMKKIKFQLGFSMIEILVSILILAFGLLGLAALQAVAMKNSHSAYYRNQATIMAHEIIDRMRAKPGVANANFASFQVAFTNTPPVGAAVAKTDLSEWINHLKATLPVPRGGVTVAGNKVTVNVEWDDSRGVNGVAVQTFTTETVI